MNYDLKILYILRSLNTLSNTPFHKHRTAASKNLCASASLKGKNAINLLSIMYGNLVKQIRFFDVI